MGANSTSLRLFFRMPKSPLLVATLSCAKFDPRSYGNQNGGRETGSSFTGNCRWIHYKCGISTEFAYLFGSNNMVGQMLELSDFRVSEKSKMAACYRKWI